MGFILENFKSVFSHLRAVCSEDIGREARYWQAEKGGI